jgi:hypothetical protein
MEAYLDRLRPERRAAAEGAQVPPRGGSDAMTREEAYAILGLKSDANDAEVREAHHRLMMGVHPDHGGSTYLAAKLNRARGAARGVRRSRAMHSGGRCGSSPTIPPGRLLRAQLVRWTGRASGRGRATFASRRR